MVRWVALVLRFDAYDIVTLTTNAADEKFVVLSYPGLEINGTIVVAPLMALEDIAVVEILHPIVQTSQGPRIVVVERLAAILPDLARRTGEQLIQNDYAIHRALSRLFFGN